MRSLLAIVLVPFLLGACAAFAPRPEPLGKDDLVRMARSGASAQVIIERLESTGTVLFLGGSDIVRLHREGVPEEVLDWLQRRQIDEIRRRDFLWQPHNRSLCWPYDFRLYDPMRAPGPGCYW
jgi:hypothetical protein